MNFKFSAMKVAEIEETFKQPLENIVSDTKISTLAMFISKGLVNEDGHIGCSINVAYDKIDEYIKEHSKLELTIDVIEVLINEGFLPKTMDVAKMRESISQIQA